MNKVWKGYVDTDCFPDSNQGVQPAVVYLMQPQCRTVFVVDDLTREPVARRVSWPLTTFTCIKFWGNIYMGIRPALLVNALQEKTFNVNAILYPFPFSNSYNYGYACLGNDFVEFDDLIPRYFESAFESNSFGGILANTETIVKSFLQWANITQQNPRFGETIRFPFISSSFPPFAPPFTFNTITTPVPKLKLGD